MSRQRLPIGTHGEITVMNLPDGRVEVRTRYRDFDGKSRLVSARAASKSAALTRLKKRLAERNLYQPVDTTLSLDSLFGELVDYWLADLDLEGRIAASTRRGYEEAMRKLVMPAFRNLTLREIGVARCDALLKQLGQRSYARSNRVVALPSFTAEAIRRRLSVMTDRSPEALVFASRGGTPLTIANVRRQLRKVLGDAGIEGVHPHMFRRTVATVVNEQASVNLAAELLGHTDPKVTIEQYIRRNEHVNPLTAELLDEAFARPDGEMEAS